MKNCNRHMIANYQAHEQDYEDIGLYDKGHLFPSSHANERDDKMSTLTLTNIVPQMKSFNSNSWNKMEACVKCVISNHCANQAFVLTGAIPSVNDPLKKPLNNRVNIPRTLWTAFCCYNNVEQRWLASAHWGDNVAHNEERPFMETNTLEALLTTHGINPFPGPECPRESTVSQYYTALNTQSELCKCPP